jgi:uncharacterized protein YbjT (DUF2867 family)
MSRNLITGGTGLVGIHLVRRLLADGEEVVLSSTSGPPHGAADPLGGRIAAATSASGCMSSTRCDDIG